MGPQDSPWCWGFTPGDQVRIVDGRFIGRTGKVLSDEEAQKRRRQGGLPFCGSTRETLWVLIDIFGRPVPVQVEPSQIDQALC